MDFRLTKAERIRRRVDFLRIQASGQNHGQAGGRKLHTASFVCFSLLPAGQPVFDGPVEAPPARLGITVSRRVGGAVVRNRLKRLLREAFRRHKQTFPRGLELVVIARAEAAQVTYAQVEQEVREVGRRIVSGASSSRLRSSGR